MTWLRRAVFLCAALYLIYGIVLVVLHPRFIYPFSQRSFDTTGYDTHSIDVPERAPLTFYVSEGQPEAPVVVYFMGNAGALELFRPMLDHHRSQGRSVVAMGYRGGGGLEGTPGERALKLDAEALYDWVRDHFGPRPVVAHGYSLGTGLAVHLGTRKKLAGVVLSAPYDRLCGLMTSASGLPACYLPVQRWDTMHDARGLQVPVLILHGTADAVVPFAAGKRLAEAIGRHDQIYNATFVPVEGAGHIDLVQFPTYLPAIDGFMDQFIQN